MSIFCAQAVYDLDPEFNQVISQNLIPQTHWLCPKQCGGHMHDDRTRCSSCGEGRTDVCWLCRCGEVNNADRPRCQACMGLRPSVYEVYIWSQGMKPLGRYRNDRRVPDVNGPRMMVDDNALLQTRSMDKMAQRVEEHKSSMGQSGVSIRSEFECKYSLY